MKPRLLKAMFCSLTYLLLLGLHFGFVQDSHSSLLHDATAPLKKVRVIREGSRAHVLGLMTKAMARETEAAGLMFLSPSSPKSAVRTQRNPIPQT